MKDVIATTRQRKSRNLYRQIGVDVFARLRELAGSKLTASGDLLITAKTHRTQDANRSEAREKLEALLEDAHRQPKKRAKTRLNRVGKTKRLAGKKARGAVKANRGKVSRSDW